MYQALSLGLIGFKALGPMGCRAGLLDLLSFYCGF